MAEPVYYGEESKLKQTMIVDMHCHVLPGVDDGPETMEDSMLLLEEAVRQHVDAMIVTPHFHPARYQVYASQIREGLARLNEEIQKAGLPITLLPGQECYFYSDLIRELDAGNVLTMAGTRYVLVEFDPVAIYSVLRGAVRSLMSSGYYPIIAHYERYQCLKGNTERLSQLRYDGAMLQMNFDTVLARDGLFRKNPWRQLLREGYVDFLGSDTHGMDFRPPHIDSVVQWMRAEVDPGLTENILERNIRLLLNP